MYFNFLLFPLVQHMYENFENDPYKLSAFNNSYRKENLVLRNFKSKYFYTCFTCISLKAINTFIYFNKEKMIKPIGYCIKQL